MPSKQTHDDDVIAIEELVHEIKQNLRLKAAAPAPSAGVVAENLNHQHPLLAPAIVQQQQNDNFHLNHPPSTTQQSLQPLPASQQQPQKPHQHQLVIKKQRSRPSPYHIPCRSWNDQSVKQPRRSTKSCKDNDENNMEDPYELLQTLLKNNSLVAEAVRRITITNSYSRKQNNYFYYDSDEERSPIVMMCQLES